MRYNARKKKNTTRQFSVQIYIYKKGHILFSSVFKFNLVLRYSSPLKINIFGIPYIAFVIYIYKTGTKDEQFCRQRIPKDLVSF